VGAGTHRCLGGTYSEEEAPVPTASGRETAPPPSVASFARRHHHVSLLRIELVQVLTHRLQQESSSAAHWRASGALWPDPAAAFDRTHAPPAGPPASRHATPVQPSPQAVRSMPARGPRRTKRPAPRTHTWARWTRCASWSAPRVYSHDRWIERLSCSRTTPIHC